MKLFNFLKKTSAPEQQAQPETPPYKNSETNFIYNLLFCDDLELYRSHTQQPYTYPFSILLSHTNSVTELQSIIDDATADPRVKILAYNQLLAKGFTPAARELLAVIVEVGLEGGLDVLASFHDGTARYINQSGKIIIWESETDTQSNELTHHLFTQSRPIIEQIGPWDQPRRPYPPKGMTRLTFLVSDGLYFGEGPTNSFFNDQLAGPALTAATRLMQYLTQKASS